MHYTLFYRRKLAKCINYLTHIEAPSCQRSSLTPPMHGPRMIIPWIRCNALSLGYGHRQYMEKIVVCRHDYSLTGNIAKLHINIWRSGQKIR